MTGEKAPNLPEKYVGEAFGRVQRNLFDQFPALYQG
jgi:hypothetical protein